MKKLIILIFAGLLVGCSTQKNTLVSRTYHNITAKYNYLFNAQESYNLSTKKYSKEYSYDYNTLLPVFLFEDKAAPSKTSEGMDRAIMKSGLLIKYHSITAKPSKAKQNTAAQRAFYNQREFCKYVDDAYLLIALGNTYLHDYDKARQAFNQIVLNYPNTDTKVEAQIWLALIAGAEGDLVQYEDALSTITQYGKCPNSLQPLLQAALANYYIKIKSYAKAIESLEQAARLETQKENRCRYLYILGQLYQKTGNTLAAQQTFHRVAKRASSYEMTFNARLEEARSYSSGNSGNLKNELQKMAKSERNTPYRDQIYYTIGKIYLQDNNEKEALSNFQKSLEYASPNSNQKGVTFATLADLAFSKKDFLKAQALYDSASTLLPDSHPLYSDVQTRSQKLGRLASSMREYQKQDSLIKLSMLNKDELTRLVDKKIEQIKTQQEKVQEEQNRQQSYLMNQNNLALGNQQSNSWYFYNQSALAFGAAEFKMRWGQRKLEDNWRRKNKGNIADFAEATKAEEKKSEETRSPLTREYYFADIPKNENERAAAIKKAQDALLDAADAYRVDIEDPKSAITTAESLLKEDLSAENRLKAYTICYQSYTALNDMANAEHYKNLIATKYPQSITKQSFETALSISNMSNADSKALEQCIELINVGKFKESLEISRPFTDKKNPLTPQFALAKALAIGGLEGKDAYRKELSSLIEEFPNTEVAKTAAEYVAQLDKVALNRLNPKEDQPKSATPNEIAATHNSEATTKYLATDGSHELVIIIPQNTNFNQLKFNLISFNLESFPDTEFNITKESFDSNNDIVRIKAFDSKKKSLDYYFLLLQKQDLINQSGASNFALFAISAQNLELLLKDKALTTYSDFFMKEYLK